MLYKRFHFKIITVIYILILLGSLIISYYSSYFPILNNNSVLELPGNRFESEHFDMSLHRLDANTPHHITYTTEVTRSELAPLIGTDLGVLLYRFASNGYSIYFNDTLIASVGDPLHGQSNLWNTGHYFIIAEALLQETNIIKIESYAQYASGLPSLPMILGDLETIKKAYNQMFLINELLISLGIGAVLFSSLTILLLSFSNKEHRSSYTFLAISAFSIGLNAVDYLPIDYLLIDHLIFKKIIMGAFYMCAAAMTIALGNYFRMDKPKYFAYFTVSVYFVLTLVIHDNLFFNKVYSYWNATNIIHVFFWTYIVWKKRKTHVEARFLFSGFILLIFFIIPNFLVDINDGFFLLNTPLFYISIIGIIAQFLIMMDFNYKEAMIHLEKENRNIEYIRATTDSLTGVKNQRYLYHSLNQISAPFTLSMLDFDDFKSINDTYGHSAGDYVLKSVINTLIQHVHDNDIICRYGGDEFVIIHRRPLDLANLALTHFLNDINQQTFTYEKSTFKIALSIGLYEVELIESDISLINKVDHALYKAKNNGKNQIYIHR